MSQGYLYTQAPFLTLTSLDFFVSGQSVYQTRLCGPAAARNECMAKIAEWQRWLVTRREVGREHGEERGGQSML